MDYSTLLPNSNTGSCGKEQFQPLKDGLSSNGIDQVEFDNGYGHHVNNIAKNISLGWYEGIFKHFGDKKVKVVSCIGEQSCGKSFMLNHLIGTTFDMSAMVKILLFIIVI